MRRLQEMLVRTSALAMVSVLTACATTHWEKHLLEVDQGAGTRSPALKEDHIRVNLVIRPETMLENRTTRGLHHVLLTGPYVMYVELCDGDRPEALASIDVHEAVLEIRYQEADIRRIKISTAPADWRIFGQPRGCIVNGLSTMPRLDVDFQRLKEIHFFLKFTGVYFNGERREYWEQQYVKPKVVHEDVNDFWERLMGV